MKNYNDIYDMKQEVCGMIDTAYSKGYDKAYNDRKIEEEFDEDRAKAINEAYQKGLGDAWECVQKIWNMIAPTRDKVFGTEPLADILESYSASEAIAKVKEYEEKKKADEEKEKADREIKVGDEITDSSGNRGVVVALLEYDDFRVLWLDGTVSIANTLYEKKTGRHFDIPNLFEQMRGDNSDDN